MFSRIEMYADMLREDPVSFLIYMAYTVVVFLFSLILHECAHGWMALRCGDPTAKMLGRLSLNPAKHLDPVGTICMFVFGFGWAKPVPVNPRNFRDYRRDDFLVSIAGIVTNLTLFIGCSLLAVMLNKILWDTDQWIIDAEYMVNVFAKQGNWSHVLAGLAYPMDLEIMKSFTNHYWLLYIQRFLLMMADVNLLLAIFNLLPIPPLDGYHVLNDTILKGRFNLSGEAFQIAHFALIALVATGLLDTILTGGSELIGGAVIRIFLRLTGQG